MSNPCQLRDWLWRGIGACLVVGGLGPLVLNDTARAETLPLAESILDEAIELVTSSSQDSGADSLLEIAVRQAKVRSCKKAQDLMRAAIDSNEKWAKTQADSEQVKARINFFDKLVAAQRRAGCVEEMKHAAERLRVLYPQQYQSHVEESMDSNLATAMHGFLLQLDLGDLYLSMGDLDAARVLAPKIVQHIRAAKWRPSWEFQKAAVFLARSGWDHQAFEVASQYEQYFEALPITEEDHRNSYRWIARVSNLAAIAEAQAQAGNNEMARATLLRAIEKASSTPVARLNEMFGERSAYAQGELRDIGEGDALQSAGAMRTVWHAARIGETALALKAFELASPFANEAGSTGELITALAKNGDLTAAQKLLDRFRCSSRAIARGLLKRQDWAGAVHAHAAYEKSSCCQRDCDFFESDTDYRTELGKARTFAQEEARALSWARNQKAFWEKIPALLGIVDALLEQGQQRGSPSK